MGRFRIDVGGSVDPGLAATSKWKSRDDEPVWFHQKPAAFFEELYHSYFVKAIVDFSPASGELAMIAMRKRIPYVGITCSENHSTCLLERLQLMTEEAMMDKDDKLYQEDAVLEDSKAEKGAGAKAKAG